MKSKKLKTVLFFSQNVTFQECESLESVNFIKKIIDICSEPKNENALICNQMEKKELALFVANMLLRNLW